MKTVIHSPEIGSAKKLLDYGKSSEEFAVDQTTSSAQPISMDNAMASQISAEQLENYPEKISELRKENERLEKEKNELQEKYATLIDDIDTKRQAVEKEAYKEGIAQAESEITLEVEKRLSAGEKIIHSLKEKVLNDIYNQENICLEIVYSTVCRLIGESAGSKEQIKGILKLTMDKVVGSNNLDVYISPHDYENLLDDEFITSNIIKSDNLEYGGCVIKTGKGSVDAKLDKQLAKLKKLLLNIHKAQ